MPSTKEKPITQAVILAAGLGERLRPLTDTVPKVMVPIGGRPLLEHTIHLLKEQGIRRFVLNLHYLPDVIISHFGDGSKFGVEIRYSDETNRLLDTAGALKKMEPWLDDDFLLLYGDQLHRFDFRPVIDFHQARGAMATMVLKRSDLPQNGEVIEVELATGRIIGYHARPHAITDFTHDRMYLNSSLYVLSRNILEGLPPDTPIHLDKKVLPELHARGAAVYGYPTTEDILDIGTLEKYQFAEEWFQKYSSRKK